MSYYNQQQPPVGVPPPQGYPPEGYPKDAYQPSGYPPQGYSPAVYPQQGYPPQGYPQPYAQPPLQQQQSSGPSFMEGWLIFRRSHRVTPDPPLSRPHRLLRLFRAPILTRSLWSHVDKVVMVPMGNARYRAPGRCGYDFWPRFVAVVFWMLAFDLAV
ncbi:hypothetical protein ZIOFF_067311 [Zingiber officinale]|uniref:Rhodopsin n=2 Tax=Zingiber officinale TaxID=94328 RepID=A0A8J5C5M3_ZINOF|nr:hypothetical protein ZIOFF_067311 [Zingiber officinale]